MKVLVACESSGAVRGAFMRRGHAAYSCDLQPSDDGNLFHYQQDAIEVIRSQRWDLVIAHPPCTHLAVSGSRHFAAKRADGRQQEGIAFFMSIVHACADHADRWAIENPIGIMSRLFEKPQQIIQPWMFGHPETKATCLWLRGVPPLIPTNDVRKQMERLPPHIKHRVHHLPQSKNRWKLRSVTYAGVARAMAEQWGGL